MDRNINLEYSVKEFSDIEVIEHLNELKKRIIFNDCTKKLIFIKYGKLNVLNSLKSIISEICDSLIIGNTQAAITLTNHLFENALKQVLITWDSNGRTFDNKLPIDETFKKEVEEYDDKVLYSNIKKCQDRGLITEDDADCLTKLKNTYRNPFSHASYSKLFKNASKVLYSGNLKNPTEVKEETTDISKVPLLYLLAQEQFANENALSYFLEVYEFIDKMDKVLLDLYPELKKFILRQSKKD